MKERPILFSAPMVRALLAGTKTQTRRPFSCQPVGTPDVAKLYRDRACTQAVVAATWTDRAADGSTCCLCPYGVPGDRLWVRETLKPWTQDPALFAYAADDTRVQGDGMNYPIIGRRYVPSIHLERCWSRIVLEVTGVRVERLQAISEADAKAEGYPRDWMPGGDGPWCSPMQWYADLWKGINGPDSWDANPWVWVVEFRRVSQP